MPEFHHFNGPVILMIITAIIFVIVTVIIPVMIAYPFCCF